MFQINTFSHTQHLSHTVSEWQSLPHTALQVRMWPSVVHYISLFFVALCVTVAHHVLVVCRISVTYPIQFTYLVSVAHPVSVTQHVSVDNGSQFVHYISVLHLASQLHISVAQITLVVCRAFQLNTAHLSCIPCM